MNRTALCIRMLILLKTNSQMSSRELAEELETNQRNIREYRKELERAGFRIDENRGRYGGYSLSSECMLPVVNLAAEERDSLFRTIEFLQASPEFPEGRTAVDGLRKVLAAGPSCHPEGGVTYLKDVNCILSCQEKQFKKSLEEAMNSRNRVMIHYQSKGAEAPVWRKLDPYAVVCSQNIWYAVGYDHRRREYRCFRISDSRLFDVKILEESFQKEKDFNINSFVGSSGIYTGRNRKYVLKVKNEFERMFRELFWGNGFEKEKEADGWSFYSFESDNEEGVLANLFHCAGNAGICEPKETAEKYRARLKDALKSCGEEHD